MFYRRLTALRTFQRHPARQNSTLPPVPPVYEWPHRFTAPLFRGRNFLRNPAVADVVADNFLSSTAAEGEGKVVIEAFPGALSFERLSKFAINLRNVQGPCILSRALLSLPRNRLRKLIILEDFPGYLEVLKVRDIHENASLSLFR